jgi:hypothetical protein
MARSQSQSSSSSARSEISYQPKSGEDKATYWDRVAKRIVSKAGDRNVGESITQGERTKELEGKTIVEKKKYILDEIKTIYKAGMLGDSRFGDIKFSGTTSSGGRGSGGMTITAKVPIDSDFGKAFDQFNKAYNEAKGEGTRKVIEDNFRASYANAGNTFYKRLQDSVRQFNYTSMGSLDDSFSTNFFHSENISIVDKAGNEVYRYRGM